MKEVGVAVVTGASRGIGRAIALELARRGVDLGLLGRSAADLAPVKAEIEALGRRAVAVDCDAGKSADVDAGARTVLAELGVPDVVVANAGIVHRVRVVDMTDDAWDETMAVNLKGPFLLARAFLPAMLPRKRGRFVAIGSISATLGTPRQSAYCASKWGTTGFVKSLAEELRGTGLQALSVQPGSVDTDMLKGSGFPPAMTADDVAKLVAYASFDAPAAMNGSAIEAFGP